MAGAHAYGLAVFLTGLATNACTLLSFIVAFCHLRRKFRSVYAGKATATQLPDSFFGWIGASLYLTVEEAIEHCGLDQAMMLEFLHFSMKLLSIVSVPMLCVMGPIQWLEGGDGAEGDHLSKLGMANVRENHPWIYWVHGALVWLVVAIVQHSVYRAQGRFLDHRKVWLKSMPPPRATTLLVQGVPDEHCTDDKLKKYFDRVFDRKVVDKAHVVKKTEHLLELIHEQDDNEQLLHQAQFEEERTGHRPEVRNSARGDILVDAIDLYKEHSKGMAKLVKEERKRVQEAAHHGDPAIYTSNAFVTFKTRRDAQLALSQSFTDDENEFVCEVAPDPADVIYEDLRKDPATVRMMAVVGYSLITALYSSYTPAVIGIAYVTNLDNLEEKFGFFHRIAQNTITATIWNAMAPSIALQFIVSFVPTFLTHIFSSCFVTKAHACLQHRVHKWYYWFHVVHILLVAAVGTSIAAAVGDIVEAPASVFQLLATTMPYSTHFFLGFVPLQWAAHAKDLLRPKNLLRYLYHRRRTGEASAKKMSEPEDQDTQGLGARTARQAFILVLALVYCSLAPLILPLAIVSFFVARLAYGYLVYFAETRKPDLGGAFWVSCLTNLQRCMLIYILLMVGVLRYRDDHVGPCLIAASSMALWAYSYFHFAGSFPWESLSLEHLISDKPAKISYHKPACTSYDQPELAG